MYNDEVPSPIQIYKQRKERRANKYVTGLVLLLLMSDVAVAFTSLSEGTSIPDDTVRAAIEAALRVAEADLVDQISLNGVLSDRG